MSYTIEKLPHEPIVWLNLTESYDFSRDPANASQDISNLLDTLDTPVYLVADIRQIAIRFSDLVGVLGLVTRGSAAVLRHPNLKELVVIGASDMVSLGVKALGQAQYGRLTGWACATPDEALEHIRSRVMEGS